MKSLVLLLISSLTFVVYSQTPLIAHKSHSGIAETYFVDPNSNFGEIEIFPEEVRRYYRSLNDSTVLRQSIHRNGIEVKDTLKNEQREHIDSFRQEDLRKLKLVDSIQKVADSLMMEEYRKLQENNENKLSPVSGTPKQNNNPPFLLVLLSVAAILMLLVRLVVRDRNTAVI